MSDIIENYVIFKDGSNIIAKNGLTENIDYIGSDAAKVVQQTINSLNIGGIIFIKSGIYDLGTTININFGKITLKGSGRSTIIRYSGTGDLIYVNGIDNYIEFITIEDLILEGNNAGIGIHLKAAAPNVVTKSVFNRLTIKKFSKGIWSESGISSEIYKNTFQEIYISDASTYGIISGNIGANGGSYNSFKNIEITQCGGYAIYTIDAYDSFIDICTDSIIRDDGMNSLWERTTIETIYPTPPVSTAFQLRGYNSTISNLVLTNISSSKCSEGLAIYNYYHTIINFRSLGSNFPTYLFIPSQDSKGVAINISGNSYYWSHLDYNRMKDWVCIGGVLQREGKNYFNGDGNTKMFQIPHGLVTKPNKAFVSLGSKDAIGEYYIDINSAYIVLNYLTAPPSGINNLLIYWKANI